MDIIGMYRLLNTKANTFSAAQESFTKIDLDHILRHKTNLNKYVSTKITPCVLSIGSPSGAI